MKLAEVGKIGIVAGLLGCALPLVAQESKAWDFPDFSATQVLTGPQAMPMKVYRRGTMVRMDRNKVMSTIYDPANSKAYNLTTYPDGSHQCVVMKTEQAKMMPSPLDLLDGPQVKRTADGTESVEGHDCKVEKVVVTYPGGKAVESRVWEATDLKGVPVKIASKVGELTLTAVYRDIVLGTPDKELFAIPEKCTPLEKMGEVVEDTGKE